MKRDIYIMVRIFLQRLGWSSEVDWRLVRDVRKASK